MTAHLTERSKGTGAIRLDRPPRRVDRSRLFPRWCLHPAAVDGVSGLPPREGAPRRPSPRRARRGGRGEPARRHRWHQPHLPGPRAPDLPGGSVRRLPSLDYVLEHPNLPWLPTEAEKVAAFEALGIDRGILPQRVYRGAAGNLRRTFRFSCRSLWAPRARSSSTSIPVTKPPRHSAPAA